jgi:hypothetical protein
MREVTLALVLLASPLVAEEEASFIPWELSVVVVHPGGAPVPGAQVSLLCPGGNVPLVFYADAKGVAEFKWSRPGPCSVTATFSGQTSKPASFSPSRTPQRLSVTVAVDPRSIAFIACPPGALDHAPGSYTLTGEELRRLPLNRTLSGILRAFPGVGP